MRTVSPASAMIRLTNDLSGSAGVVVHHDVARLRILEELVDGLVDDEPILILQRRLHALAFDPRHLKPEGNDEGGVYRRRREGLQPGHQLLAHADQELLVAPPAGRLGLGGQ